MAFGLVATPAVAEPVKLLAAGSLRAALSEASQAFTAAEGTEVAHDFAPSGLLRERIMEEQQADLVLTYCTNAVLAAAECRRCRSSTFPRT